MNLVQTAMKSQGWQAGLSLEYVYKDGKTVLLKQDRRGPLFVQKPFYPEGPQTCHTYILHPPGGVVGGDGLDVSITLKGGGHAVVTTPAAGKFYRSAGPRAVQTNRMTVADGAVLEWLPQETIVYDGADLDTRTIVDLDHQARFIGWEMICLGLPACNRPFKTGRLTQSFEIRRNDQPLCIEPVRIGADDPVLTARWGLAGRPVFGTMTATADRSGIVSAIREAVKISNRGDLFTVTRLKGLILCRYLGDDVYAGLNFFRRAWDVLRPAVIGRPPCEPRIWST